MTGPSFTCTTCGSVVDRGWGTVGVDFECGICHDEVEMLRQMDKARAKVEVMIGVLRAGRRMAAAGWPVDGYSTTQDPS